ENIAGLHYAARYEHARCLAKAGLTMEARQQFVRLYKETLKKEQLPAIDADFRQMLAGDSNNSDHWLELVRNTTRELIEKGYRTSVFILARQCWELEDQPLANHLVRTVLKEISNKKDRLPLTLASIVFFRQTGQLNLADDLLRKLVTDPETAKRPGLWRLAGQIASERDMRARALFCLEKALEAEYQNPLRVIDLQSARQDYAKLLGHYRSLAQAMLTLEIKPPADFLAKVVRATDRWRALDPDSAQACNQAGRILQMLGQPDLSWDYLTTPIAMQPNEAAP